MTKSKKPVGYKVTPKHTRFKPGQSGNPKGRPKKKDQPSWAEVLEKELNTKVPMNVGGKRVMLTKMEVIQKRIVLEAGQGSVKHLKMLLDLIKYMDLGKKNPADDSVKIIILDDIRAEDVRDYELDSEDE